MNLAQHLNADGILTYTFISAFEKLAFFCLKPKIGYKLYEKSKNTDFFICIVVLINLKYISSQIKKHGGRISYDSNLRANINGATYRMARKMCPNRKIRTRLTDEDISTLRRTHSLETGMSLYFGSRSIWTGTVR